MNMPTILVDGHVLDGTPQGTCAYIAGLYSAVARRGMARVLVAAEHENSVARWFPDVAGIDWVPLTTHNKFARLGVEFDRLATRWRPDYMHFQYVAPLRKRCRWIVTVHDLLFLDLPGYFPLRYRVQNHALFRLSARRADVLLTVSDYSRAAVARHFHLPVERVHVTINGIDSFLSTKPERVPGLVPGRFFVYVSRFEPRKNQDGLVRAFRDLNENFPDDVVLVLVGNPSLDYPALDAELAATGIRVKLMSGLTQGALVWLQANAAASLYPSFAEGFGIPPLEAVAAGGVSYCAANTAMLDFADCVHSTFDPGDIEDIKRVMRRGLAGDDRARSPALRKKVAQRFSWESAADQFAKALALQDR